MRASNLAVSAAVPRPALEVSEAVLAFSPAVAVLALFSQVPETPSTSLHQIFVTLTDP